MARPLSAARFSLVGLLPRFQNGAVCRVPRTPRQADGCLAFVGAKVQPVFSIVVLTKFYLSKCLSHDFSAASLSV